MASIGFRVNLPRTDSSGRWVRTFKAGDTVIDSEHGESVVIKVGRDDLTLATTDGQMWTSSVEYLEEIIIWHAIAGSSQR
jgi:hypothetical protein